MPQRRRQLREKRKLKTKHLSIFVKILLPIFLILVAILTLFLNTKYWNGKDKFIFVSKSQDGGALVTILDPKLDEETILAIPGETEVTVARSLGILRLKNVWQLGINEKIEGKLVVETISQNFLFPVFLFRDASSKKTNIPLGDSLFVKLFLLGVKPINKTEVDLGKSQFLTKLLLNDGAFGYRLTGPVSAVLSAYFSDNDLSGQALRVGIEDGTGKFGVAQKVGEIIEVVGGKVVSIDKVTSDDKKEIIHDVDCLVSGKNIKIARKISNLFSCKVENQKTDFDIEVDLGEKFAKRF